MDGHMLELGNVIENPIKVKSAEDIAWDDAVDVLVVGYGGAGVVAALEAHEQGADVLVLERFEGGGATAYSGGVVYAGGGTMLQKATGCKDSPENMYNYLSIDVKDTVSEETLRQFCNESSENMDWLVKHGVSFEGSLYEFKTSCPPNGNTLYYSGNEKLPAYASKAHPAPRGHVTVGKGGWTGNAYFAALKKSAAASGIKVETHTRVVRLIQDSAARVVGVETLTITDKRAQERHQALYNKTDPKKPFSGPKSEKSIKEARSIELEYGERKRIRANKGSILTAGGYVYNLDMLSKYNPTFADAFESIMRFGSIGCDGSGIQMGQSVGGGVKKMERTFIGNLLFPPYSLVNGLAVNANGERFVNEDVYISELGDAISAQPKGEAWLVIDNKTFWTSIAQSIRESGSTFLLSASALVKLLFGGTKKSSTLEGLARKCGMSTDALVSTVEDANRAKKEGSPDPVGKSPENMRMLGKGPYRAVNISITNKMAFTVGFTLGGLCVDEKRGVVLREDGSPIEGLYAAGRTAAGVCSGRYYSGLSLADCLFSGRRAARNAALDKV